MLNVEVLATDCERALPLIGKGEFFGPAADLAIGCGVIVDELVQPIFLPDRNVYGTIKAAALVLTHECDIDPANIRPFNENAIVLPLIRLDRYIERQKGQPEASVRAFLMNVVIGNTTRVVYLPRHGNADSPLYYGALCDLNLITSCGVAAFEQAKILCALTGYGLNVVDKALQNHLFREKSDRLPPPY